MTQAELAEFAGVKPTQETENLPKKPKTYPRNLPKNGYWKVLR